MAKVMRACCMISNSTATCPAFFSSCGLHCRNQRRVRRVGAPQCLNTLRSRRALRPPTNYGVPGWKTLFPRILTSPIPSSFAFCCEDESNATVLRLIVYTSRTHLQLKSLTSPILTSGSHVFIGPARSPAMLFRKRNLVPQLLRSGSQMSW